MFCRVGGPGSLKVRTSVMVHVAASHVILDNVWLWRADHAELAPGEQPRPGEQYHLVVPGECSVENGLIVDGDDVTAYGLAVEHTDQDQVVWRGERGRTYFYQCELPYDVNQTMFGDKGTPATVPIAAVKKRRVRARRLFALFSRPLRAWSKRPSSRRTRPRSRSRSPRSSAATRASFRRATRDAAAWRASDARFKY